MCFVVFPSFLHKYKGNKHLSKINKQFLSSSFPYAYTIQLLGKKMNQITYPLQIHPGMTQNGSLSCFFHPVTLSCSGTGSHCKDHKGHLRQKDCVSAAWLGWISSFGLLWWGSLESKPEIGNSQIYTHAMLCHKLTNQTVTINKHKSNSL